MAVRKLKGSDKVFAQLDPRRISMLCQHKDNVNQVVEFLELKGFRVEVETVPTSFFKLLEEGRPGIVMVSSESEERHGRVIAGFVQRKFKAPVLLFRESKNEMVRGRYSPEVHKVDPHNLDGLLEEIQNFKSKYDERVQKVEKKVRPEQEEIHARHKQFWKDLETQIAPSLGVNVLIDSCVVSTFQPLSEDEKDNSCYAFVFPENTPIEKREEIVNSVAQKLREQHGHESEGNIVHFDQSLSRDVVLGMDEKADRKMSGLFQDVEMNFVFMDEVLSTPMETGGVQADLFLVPVEEWWARYGLPSNLFLWLPRNARAFVLVRSGRQVAEAKIERFKKYPEVKTGVPLKQARSYRLYRDLVYHMMDAA